MSSIHKSLLLIFQDDYFILTTLPFFLTEPYKKTTKIYCVKHTWTPALKTSQFKQHWLGIQLMGKIAQQEGNRKEFFLLKAKDMPYILQFIKPISQINLQTDSLVSSQQLMNQQIIIFSSDSCYKPKILFYWHSWQHCVDTLGQHPIPYHNLFKKDIYVIEKLTSFLSDM